MTFAPTPDQAGEKFKQTLKFGEERRTLWLNLHGKDSYGRHRGYVLYGMDARVTGPTQITIAPGAVYTPWGTRIYIEANTDPTATGYNVIDVSSVANWNVDAGSNPLPHKIAIVLELQVFNAKQMPSIDGLTEYQVQAKLVAKQVPFGRSDVSPALNLDARDPVLLGTAYADQTPYTTLSDYGDADMTVSTGASPLTFVQIPLAFVMVGVDPASAGTPPVNLTSEGVTITQCKNAFSMLVDVLGFDIFAGRVGEKVTRHTGGTGTAVDQALGSQLVATATAAEVLAPKFGTCTPTSTPANEPNLSDADKAAWRNAAWADYRQPSFFRDGDSFLWALRRLDYVLRLWLDRTGDQQLIAYTQDGGSGVEVSRTRLQMDALLKYFNGGTNPSFNKNLSNFETTNANNSTVMDARPLPHSPSTMVSVPTGSYGDTHRTAIGALSEAIRHVLTDLIGVSISQTDIRAAAAWTAPISGSTIVAAITALAGGSVSAKVNRSGDTMTSGANLTFVGSGEVLGLPGTPSAGGAASSKTYVDAQDALKVSKSGDTMGSAANLTFAGGGEVLGLPATPSGATAAASKAYVDALTGVIGNPSYLDEVEAVGSTVSHLATNGNLTGTSTAATVAANADRMQQVLPGYAGDGYGSWLGYVKLVNTLPSTNYEARITRVRQVWSGGLLTALIIQEVKIVENTANAVSAVAVATPITLTVDGGWVTFATWSGTSGFIARAQVVTNGSNYDLLVGYTGDTGNPAGQYDRYAQARAVRSFFVAKS